MEKDDQELSINNVDRISELPDPICHHIMSFLPAKDARTTTFLARRWRSLWYSSPVYNFDQDFFPNDQIIWKFLEETLVRRKRNFNDLSIEKFRVCVLMSDNIDFRNIVWNWIGSALRRNVKELSIINSKGHYPITYSPSCRVLPPLLQNQSQNWRLATSVSLKFQFLWVCLHFEN